MQAIDQAEYTFYITDAFIKVVRSPWKFAFLEKEEEVRRFLLEKYGPEYILDIHTKEKPWTEEELHDATPENRLFMAETERYKTTGIVYIPDSPIPKQVYKRPYTTPLLVKQPVMRLAQETIEEATGKLICRQCSSCHGCR